MKDSSSPIPVKGTAVHPRDASPELSRSAFCNPKAVVFFSSIFAVFVPTSLPVWMQAAMIALLVSFVAGRYLAVACIFSLGPITRAYYRARYWVDRCTGGIFLTLSLILVVAH